MKIEKKQVVRGITWSAFDTWGTQLITFVIIIVLARLLSPDAFGLVALASVFTSFLAMWVDQGISHAIVQRDELSEDHLNTAFWANVVLGALFGLCSAGFSGLIASLYKEPELQPIILWLSIVLVISGFSQTQIGILRRRMDFKSLAKRSVIAKSIGGISGIIAAIAGCGVYSLVIQTLVHNVIAVIVLWNASDWVPKLEFSWTKFRELYVFGVNVTASHIISFASNQFDSLIIGYFLGATALGYYRVGFTLVQRVSSLVGGVLQKVSLSYFSRLQDDLERLRRYLYQSVEYLSIVMFPLFLGLTYLAPDIVVAFFGDEWIPSIAIVKILAISSLIRIMLSLNETAIFALGMPKWVLWVRGGEAIIRLVSFILITPYGINYVAVVHLITTILLVPIHLSLTKKIAKFHWRVYFQQFYKAVIASVVMMLGVVVLNIGVSQDLNIYLRLAIIVLISGSLYMGSLYLLDPIFVKDSWKLLISNVILDEK